MSTNPETKMEGRGAGPGLFSNEDILAVNQKLLDSIASGNFEVYKELCADDLTCFEPESCGLVVQGLGFHKYYFDLGATRPKPTMTNNITMSNPHIRWLGNDAVVLSYTRLDQVLGGDSKPLTKTTGETRVWEIRNGALVHVHFHKS